MAGWKRRLTLEQNAMYLTTRFPPDALLLITLTFADHVTDPAEAQRRFHSWATNWLRHRCRVWVAVLEAQQSGRLHYHILSAWEQRFGTLDWSALDTGDYSSASTTLRTVWRDLRTAAPRYGFGRTEALPIRQPGRAVASYVGKYLAKRDPPMSEPGHRCRRVRYSRGWRVAWSNFGSVAQGRSWRLGCDALGFRPEILAKVFGPHWSWHLRDTILAGTPLSPNQHKAALVSIANAPIHHATKRRLFRQLDRLQTLPF